MKQKLIELLESIGYPAYLQGSLLESEEYPDSFFTFWVFDAPEDRHYNNQAVRCKWGFWIFFYSTNAKLVETIPCEIMKILKENDFILSGKPMDTKSDAESHTGSRLTTYYIEQYKEQEE